MSPIATWDGRQARLAAGALAVAALVALALVLVPEAAHASDEATTISADSPTWGVLSLDQVVYVVEHMVWSWLRGTASGALEVASWLLTIMDASADPLFSFDFTEGTFGAFYTVASVIATRVGVPFATAFLGITFMLAMLRLSEDRQKNRLTSNYGHAFILLVLGFAVCWWLIYHAIDIVAIIYTFGTSLVRLVTAALATVGIDSAGSSVASSLSTSILGAFDSLTYADMGWSFVILVFAVLAMAACAGVMWYVITIAVLRILEIYLRAAFAPITMSFFVNERTRQIGWSYLKRLGSLCFQAGIIIVALSMSSLFFDVSATVISGLFTDASTTLTSTLSALIPTFIAIFSISAIVRKAEPISNSLFGLS